MIVQSAARRRTRILFAWMVVALFVFPLYYWTTVAFKDAREIFDVPPNVWSFMCPSCRAAGRVPRSWADDSSWGDQRDEGQGNGGWGSLPGYVPLQPDAVHSPGWLAAMERVGIDHLGGWGRPRDRSWGSTGSTNRGDWGGAGWANGGGWATGIERGNGWGQIPRRPEEELEE